ncbi:hypothetical protein [Acinetobacter baumannii]|uniref:hypothetical protein n=1 Tax=Acinetobacter baumannii TaxID=470 RepID=UPI001BB46E1B|nr:hypothetical protein [Acinetobacter baumannii]
MRIAMSIHQLFIVAIAAQSRTDGKLKALGEFSRFRRISKWFGYSLVAYSEMSEKIKAQEPNIDLSYKSTMFMGVNRVLELHPKNGENLKKFIEIFNEKKFFYLTNMKEKLDIATNPSFYTSPLKLEEPEDYIDFDNAILKKDINIKTLDELKAENPKSLDHAALHTIDTRKKTMQQNIGKSLKEKKTIEKRKRKAKEVKKTKKQKKK